MHTGNTKQTLLLLTAMLLWSGLWPSPAAAETGCDLRLTGARIWNGAVFEAGSLAIAAGRLVEPGAPSCAEEMDLGGRYVTPPFGEGHSHNIEAAWIFPSINQRHLAEGVFYVMSMNTHAPVAMKIREQTRRADTVDVAFAMGGLTSYHGHPEGVYVITLAQIMYGNAGRDAFVGQAFHTIGSPADIDPALDALRSQGADFVKIYLEGSEDFASTHAFIADEANWQQLKDDVRGGELTSEALRERLGATSVGLDPALVPEIVHRAKTRGFRVMAHVGTARDFEVAMQAGVDAAVHMPGGFIAPDETLDDLRLSDAGIAAARASGAAVVATANVRPEFVADDERVAVHALQRDNIRRLLDAGVPVLIGTDRWDVTTLPEVRHLVNIGAMTLPEVFEAWIATGRFAFPDRRIGSIEPGFEADFLVFDEDPRTSLEALQSISLRFKAGRQIELPEADKAP